MTNEFSIWAVSLSNLFRLQMMHILLASALFTICDGNVATFETDVWRSRRRQNSSSSVLHVNLFWFEDVLSLVGFSIEKKKLR